jgi:hypothetical protein
LVLTAALTTPENNPKPSDMPTAAQEPVPPAATTKSYEEIILILKSLYCRQCHWPAEKIQDKNKRLAIAKKMWSEIMAECSRLGNRSLTSVFYKLASSHVFIEAEDLVNAEHRASTSSAGGGSSDKTPAKKQRSERMLLPSNHIVP